MGSIGNILKKINLRFSKKLGKRILGVLILVGVGTSLFSHNTVYAAVDNAKTVEKTQDKMLENANVLFDIGLKLIYALLWPVLFIAGIALDNTLVYGSFLHLDASLWSLRNIMKNFANFALGFMVLYAIVRSLFDINGSEDKRSPMKVIKKTLIAGVLIQMSWFLMAATIDVSTILTYSIGGLPMTVMENDPQTKSMPILGINANLNMKGDATDSSKLDYYSTYGDKNISQCLVKEVKGLSGKYIIARERVRVDDDNFFEEGLCTMGAWPYRYEEIKGQSFSDDTDNTEYKTNLDSYRKGLGSGEAKQLKDNCNIIATDFYNANPNCLPKNSKYGSLKYKKGEEDIFFQKTEGITIDSLLEKSKGFVGPFITIYSSLLDYSSLTKSPDASESLLSNFFIFAIKFFFAAALFFPLLALAIVLIARIGILWLSIAMMPIIVLLKVFDIGGEKLSSGLFTYFDIGNLVKLIFAPVFVVFAISMSMIFLTALDTDHAQDEKGKEVYHMQLEELGITKNDKTYSILGLIDIDLDMDEISDGMDTFSWLITNLFSVGIIWFFLFFAVKMTKIGESIGGGIQKTVGNLVKNMPIIPIAGGVGISAVGKGLERMKGKLVEDEKARQLQELRKSMPWLYGEPNPEKEDRSAATKENAWANYSTANTIYAAAIAAGKTMTMDEAFNQAGVTSAQKDIINVDNSNYINEFHDYSIVLGGKSTEEKNISTFDASKYTADTIKGMVDKGGSWQDWAKGVVGGNVRVAGGETMVMVNTGTTSDPDFKLVSQDVYAKDYLGQTDDGKYDETKSNENIDAKIKAQYIAKHGEEEKMTQVIKDEMSKHIKAQQKEVADRLTIIEEKAGITTDNTNTQSNKDRIPS